MIYDILLLEISEGLRPLPLAPFCFMGLPFWGLGSSLDFARIFHFSASKNIVTPREQPSIHFNISCLFSPQIPFERLCAFFLTFRDPIFAAQEHLGIPFWHLGSTLGNHFGVSEAPWEAILAHRDHPGEPWEQQDGHEVTNNMILVDFGVISGLVYVSFWSSK